MALVNKNNQNWCSVPSKLDKMEDVITKAQQELGDFTKIFKKCTKIWSLETKDSGEAIYIGLKDE